MVGVPGRSKGCNTCIQRKIKCDQGIPLCRNCQKSNRICTGYKRPLGVVFSRDTTMTVPVANQEEGIVIHHVRWKSSRTSTVRTPYKNTKPRIVWVEGNSICPSPRRQVSIRTAMRQQFHCHYLSGYIPNDVHRSHPQHILPISWVIQLQHADVHSPVLDLSLTALFSARVGACNGDANLVSQSHFIYIRALQKLRQALVNPHSRLSDETLAACITLLTYELTDRPTGPPLGFPAHLRGAITILNLRGPDSLSSPLSFSIFLTLRSLSVMHSLMHRHKSIFLCPEWMDKPWAAFPRSPLDELTGMYLDISTAVQERNTMLNPTNVGATLTSLHGIIAKFSQIDSDLQSWYSQFQNAASGPLYWAEFSTLENSADDATLGKLFPVSYHFPSFFIGHVVTMYWNAMTMVHLHLSVTYDTLGKVASSPNSDSMATQFHQHDLTWRDMVGNLCRSAEYFSQNNIGGFGPMTIFPFLYGAKLCLERMPGRTGSDREIQWIGDCVYRMLRKFCFPIHNILGHYETWKTTSTQEVSVC